MSENKKNVPKRRFREFENAEAWEQYKLSDVASMKARIGWQGLTKDEFLDTGDYYLITGTDFNNGQINFNNCHYIDQERYNQDRNIQVKNGDVLITKDGTIGKVAYIRDMNKPATLNAGVFVVKGKDKNISNLYLYHYLAAPYLLNYADKQATGGTIKHLNQNVLVNFPVPLPEVKEQKKIGHFLTKLDNLITLHQRKLDKMKALKKAYLTEMFPAEGERKPKLRFAGFTDDWEQCKLGDLSESFEYGLNASAMEFDGKNKYIRITDIDDESREFLNTDLTSPNIDLSRAENFKLQNGDIVFARTGASVGKSYIYKDSDGLVYYAGFLIRARIKPQYSAEFVFQNTLTAEYNNFIRITSQRSGQPGVNAQEYSEYVLNVPKFEEQTKIGIFFRNIADLINLHQRKLEKLQNIKKAYLNEMFI